MSKTISTKYRFIVKEGEARELGEHAPTFLACEPLTLEPEFLGDNGMMTIVLRPDITIEEAQEIARYLEERVVGINFTTF